MITNFNDFTLNNTTSHHQLLPDAKEVQSAKNSKDHLQCPFCERKPYKDNRMGQLAYNGHLVDEHWDKPNVKDAFKFLTEKESTTTQGQKSSNRALKRRHEQIDEKLAEQ
jgi:citrate synthase